MYMPAAALDLFAALGLPQAAIRFTLLVRFRVSNTLATTLMCCVGGCTMSSGDSDDRF